MKILIVGGSGFIGVHVAHRLLSLGHEITVLSRNPDKISTSALPGARLVSGCISDFTAIEKALHGQEVVIHCALGWGDSAVDMIQRDTLPSVHLFEKASASSVRRIIYTSSAVATGEYRSSMDANTASRPIDYYSATKSAAEGYLLAISHRTGMRCNIVRPVYTFGNPLWPGGPTQPDATFRNMASSAVNNLPISIIKNGGVQLIPATTLATLYERLISHCDTRNILIAGSDRQYSWRSIAESIISKLGSSSEIIMEDLGWSSEGSTWSNQETKQLVPEVAECDVELENHIEYVCSCIVKTGLHTKRVGGAYK